MEVSGGPTGGTARKGRHPPPQPQQRQQQSEKRRRGETRGTPSAEGEVVGRAVAGLDQSLINGRMEKRLTAMMAAVIEPKFLGKTAEQARRT